MYPPKTSIDIPMPPVQVIPQPESAIQVPLCFTEDQIEPVTGFFKQQIIDGGSPDDSLMPNTVKPLNGGILTAPDVGNGGNQTK